MSENTFGKAGCVMAGAAILISAYQMGKINGEENQTVQPSTSKYEQTDNDQNADKNESNEKAEVILRQQKAFSHSVVEKAAGIASGGNQEVKEFAAETISVLELNVRFWIDDCKKSIEIDSLMEDDHKTISESVVEDNTGCKCFICLEVKVNNFRVIKVVVRSGGCAEMILLSRIVKNYLENRTTTSLEKFNAFNIISNSEYRKVYFGKHVKVLWKRAVSDALKDLKSKQQNIVE